MTDNSVWEIEVLCQDWSMLTLFETRVNDFFVVLRTSFVLLPIIILLDHYTVLYFTN